MGMKMDNSMKIRVFLGLCVVLGAGFISVRAADTPAQAAARAALEQMLNRPDDSQTQSLPATNTLSKAVVEQRGKPATSVTETILAKAVTPQTAPVATTPVPVPATVGSVAVAPAAVSRAAVSPTTPFLLLSLLFLSLLLILLLIMSLLMLKLRALKLLLLKHPAIVASGKLQHAGAPATHKPTPSPVAAKRPVLRRKRVHQQNGAESNGNLTKIDWATAKAERRESRIKG
jgi:hypothetical protein